MRSCEAVRAELKAYCDGELGFLTRVRVRRHLARCAPCQTEVQALRRIGEELRHLDRQIVPSPELRARILQSLPDEPPMPARMPSRSGLFAGWTLAGATAVGGLLVVIFYRMNPPGATMQTADRAAVTAQSPALAKKPVTKRPTERPRMVKALPEEQQAMLHPKAASAGKRPEVSTGAPPAKSQVNLPWRSPSSPLPSAGSGAEQFHSMAGNRTPAEKRPKPTEPNVPSMLGREPVSPASKPKDKAGQPEFLVTPPVPVPGIGDRGALSAKRDHLDLAYKHPKSREETIQLIVDDLEARLREVEVVAKAEDAIVGRARKSTDTGRKPAATVVILVSAERAPELKKKLLTLGMEEALAKRFAPVTPLESPIAIRRAQAAEKRSETQHRDADSAVPSEPEVWQDAATPAREYVPAPRGEAPGPERLQADAKTRQNPPLVRFVVRLQQSPRPASAPVGTKK